MASPPSAPRHGGKSVEQIYKKMTQIEHILARPDTYVGSLEHQTERMWVWESETGHIVQKQITFCPGLYKIFDEILVNAADNLQRDPKHMNTIKVDIDAENGFIKVYNNGKGLPIQIHKEHHVYVPELVFGHLLTSDNYDDKEKKVTGGRNGYGAKLSNIFSKKFLITTADRTRKKLYKQQFEKSMQKKKEPVITDYDKEDFTCVQFWPDLEKFGMTHLDADIVSLMSKRVIDVAGTSASKKCKVYLNGKRVPISSFKDYAELYLTGEWVDAPKIYEKVSDRWEVLVTLSDPAGGGGQFQQVSFANSINTVKGGTHVNHVAEQIVNAVLKKAQTKNKGGMELKPFQVKNHMWLFVNALIENPTFDSQTKETLTLKVGKFGSKCVLSEGTMKKVLSSGIVDQVVNWAKFKQTATLQSKIKGGTGGQTRIFGVPKLEDANDAGGRYSDRCTLILTEGDSAKALAVAGLGVIGRDKYGVFPLRGKVLNVREASYKQTVDNKEIQAILKIIGLEPRKAYDGVKGLRYGSIMVMTDQDLDGSHIKGLLINLVHHWWPGLLQTRGFMKEFVTPIVKCVKGRRELSFFTLTEYEEWKRNNNDGKGWKIKYYKGLGTSTSKEAQQYFSQISKHSLSFDYRDGDDGEAIDMAFNKKRADDRKEWINGYADGDCVDHSKASLRYLDFINKELVQFSKYDVMRSIPSMVDGFKPSQRKVLYCALKRNLKSDTKVAQFVGYVSEHSAYHHGEQSLESCIVGMAQDFTGSNNLNLLFPSGQFGTRQQGGKDAASGRYIYTRLSKYTRTIFHPDDDDVLEYLTEEGQSIEPKWYCPIIPMVLVNGAEGIGTGWSTNVLSYDPREIIHLLRALIRGVELHDIHPWYRGFTGSVERNDKNGYDFVGKVRMASDDRTVDITELPVKTWTQNYKEFLQEMMQAGHEAITQEKKAKAKAKRRAAAASSDAGSEPDTPPAAGGGEKDKEKKKGPVVKLGDLKEYHTEHSVHFKCTLQNEAAKSVVDSLGLEKAFKLRSAFSTTNMVLFDRDGKIRRYDSVLDIIKDFADLRLDMYVKRKDSLIAKLTKEILILSNKCRFVMMVINGEIVFQKKKIVQLMEELKRKKFMTMMEIDAQTKAAKIGSLKGKTVAASSATSDEVKSEGESSEEEEEADEEAKVEKQQKRSGYDYLLAMSMWSLTLERVEAMERLLHDKEGELKVLRGRSIEEMWDRDLVQLLAALDEDDERRAKDIQAEARYRKNKPKMGKLAAKKKKGASPSSSENDYGSEDEIMSDASDVKPSKKKGGKKAVGHSEDVISSLLQRYKADGDLCEVDRTTLEVKPMEADAWRKVKKEEGDKTKASSRGGTSVNPSPSASPTASSTDDTSTTKKIEMAHQRSSSILERLRMKNEGKSASSQVVKSSEASGGKQLTMSSFLKPKAEVKVTEENWLDSLVASRKNKDEVDAESEDSGSVSKPPTPKGKAKAKAKRKSPAKGKKNKAAASSSEVSSESSAEEISSDDAPDSPVPRSRRPARAAAARAARKKLIASSDSSDQSGDSGSESASGEDSPLSDFSDISEDRPKKNTLKRKVTTDSPAKPNRKSPAGGRKRRKVVRLDSDDDSDEDYNDSDYA